MRVPGRALLVLSLLASRTANGEEAAFAAWVSSTQARLARGEVRAECRAAVGAKPLEQLRLADCLKHHGDIGEAWLVATSVPLEPANPLASAAEALASELEDTFAVALIGAPAAHVELRTNGQLRRLFAGQTALSVPRGEVVFTAQVGGRELLKHTEYFPNPREVVRVDEVAENLGTTPRRTATEAAREALRLARLNDIEAACQLFEESHAAFPHVYTALNLAECALTRNGVEAGYTAYSAAYAAHARDLDPRESARTQRILVALRAKLSPVRIEAGEGVASLSFDEKPYETPTHPELVALGRHRVSASVESGYWPYSRDFVSDDANATTELRVEPYRKIGIDRGMAGRFYLGSPSSGVLGDPSGFTVGATPEINALSLLRTRPLRVNLTTSLDLQLGGWKPSGGSAHFFMSLGPHIATRFHIGGVTGLMLMLNWIPSFVLFNGRPAFVVKNAEAGVGVAVDRLVVGGALRLTELGNSLPLMANSQLFVEYWFDMGGDTDLKL